MEFKDYYATLGVDRQATQDQIKRAFRKLARKFHPDLSKEPDAEARFKAVAEAHEALIDPERRAAYDDIAQRHARGQPFDPPPGWSSGYEYSGRGRATHDARPHTGEDPFPEHRESADFSEFFESLFGHGGRQAPQGHSQQRRGGSAQGRDHHAQVSIGLQDSYRGAQQTLFLRMPVLDDAGHASFQERRLDVHIPKGIRAGQRLRLPGQGGPGLGGAPAGDLYLEVQILPHPVFRLEGSDLYFDLPVSPWEAALGATVTAPTPAGSVQLSVPPDSSQGRKLRLKGRGLPGQHPGDLYAVLHIALPSADAVPDKAAYTALAKAFPGYNPRAVLEA